MDEAQLNNIGTAANAARQAEKRLESRIMDLESLVRYMEERISALERATPGFDHFAPGHIVKLKHMKPPS